jgi:hypothetical protein
MQSTERTLRELQVRARRGDPAAFDEFERDFAPLLKIIVGRQLGFSRRPAIFDTVRAESLRNTAGRPRTPAPP